MLGQSHMVSGWDFRHFNSSTDLYVSKSVMQVASIINVGFPLDILLHSYDS